MILGTDASPDSSLAEPDSLNLMTASSTDEDHVTATVASDASPGTYSITVSNLATVHKMGTVAYSSTSGALWASGDTPVNDKAITLDSSDTLSSSVRESLEVFTQNMKKVGKGMARAVKGRRSCRAYAQSGRRAKRHTGGPSDSPRSVLDGKG